MIVYLLEALGGTLLVALTAYCAWHEDKLIAFENQITKAIKERISRHAVPVSSQMQASKRPQRNRRSRERH